jgi:hypothetical protein
MRAHRNANGLLEDLVTINYIDIVYKTAKHTLNVYGKPTGSKVYPCNRVFVTA